VLPLLDLSQCNDDELRGKSLFGAYLCLLKYIQRDELAERLPELLRLFRQILPPATALESLETILRYVTSSTDRVSRDELMTAVTLALKDEGDSLMPTIAEQWKQEGIEQGREEGRDLGREEGKLIGRIRTLEEILRRPLTSEESLASRGLDQLRQLSETLEAELRK